MPSRGRGLYNASMKDGRFLRSTLPVASGALVLALAVSAWALVLGEKANRRLYLEYEVYRTLTALTDLARDGSLGDEDTGNVLAFGIYAPDGSPVRRFGDAPETLEAGAAGRAASRFVVREESVVMVRQLGGDLPGGRRMMGRGMPGPAQAPMMGMVYLEYSTGDYRRAGALLVAVAVVATAALGALFALLLVMNRRYALAQDKEARDRELVELGQAARTIAHEIKNPLGVIRIQCGFLKKGADPGAKAGLDIIDAEAVRLADLADRIRSYLRSGEAKPGRVGARAFLEAFAARYGDSLESVLDVDGDAALDVDDEKLREALDNVVTNALEAANGSGEKPLFEAAARQRRLTLSVSDRGPGVRPADRARLFEPFYTTKEKGSGLGLALARKHVEAAGGSIAYADRAGGGSVFTVSLPLVPRD